MQQQDGDSDCGLLYPCSLQQDDTSVFRQNLDKFSSLSDNEVTDFSRDAIMKNIGIDSHCMYNYV